MSIAQRAFIIITSIINFTLIIYGVAKPDVSALAIGVGGMAIIAWGLSL